MSDKLSRRSFFRLVGGGVAAVAVAPKLLAEKIIQVPVELGWTWYIDKSKLNPALSELISYTLRNNKDKIVDNMFENNALLVKLKDGTKAQLNITKIPSEVQTERMLARMEQKKNKYKNPKAKTNDCDKIAEDNSTREYYPGYYTPTDMDKYYGPA